MLTHALALEFVDSTFEEQHAPKVVAVYRERRNALLHAAEHSSDWFEWDVPPGGMFVWMRARDGTGAPVINTNDLYAYAVDEKVAFVPSSVFDFEGRLTTAMRVNFSRSSPEVIAEEFAPAACRGTISDVELARAAEPVASILLIGSYARCPQSSKHQHRSDCRKSRSTPGAL